MPSLRQLRLQAAENTIVNKFDDPNYWYANGCFVCDRSADKHFRVHVQLQPALYETIVVGPERRSVPIIYTIARALFGRLAGYAVLAADGATQKTESVLFQEEVGIEFSLYSCEFCNSQSDVLNQLSQTLIFHSLYLEMKEDFPSIRIVNIAPKP